ncbi:KIF20B [Symbiodinium necroappetens]|uniref:KIF20B protein n=1 Tax=Symbiodinium necroappetens TaxID=1628268 RepID=A0A812Z6V0_9DINO|nr:KIF20B [Symbiodinium necroappetens]
MECCLPGRFRTPLELHAKSLQRAGGAISMHFPMFTIPVETLLKMTTIEPHEELQAQGSLVVFDRSMGNAAFVSHQRPGSTQDLG